MSRSGARRISFRIMTAASLIILLLMKISLQVFADRTILLSLSAQTDVINSGDIININIKCDSFDSVIDFGPVQILYDDEKFQYVSLAYMDVLSGYDITVDDSEEGAVSFYGEFEEITDGETGLLLEPFDTDEETVLFQLSLRARQDASGEASVRIGSTGTFIRKNGGYIESYSAEALIINIVQGVSSDASLASLNIDGVTMTPAFDPAVTEYSANVSRDMDNLTVNAASNNGNSIIAVTGADNLQNGENIISVRVLAEDGITFKEYKIYVNKQESFIPEGSGFIDFSGETYTFMSFPQGLDVPEGFVQTDRVINGYTVPVFARDGIASVLVYVYNGIDSPNLYFYNPVTGITTPYDPNSTVVSVGKVLTLSDPPEEINIPYGFTEQEVQTPEGLMKGFANKSGDFLAYFTDDAGEGSFYYYDRQTGNYYEYKSVEHNAEHVYRVLFYIFITICVVQSLMMTISFIVISRIVKNRTNPKPKHV